MTRRMAERRAIIPVLEYIIAEALQLTAAERAYIVLFGAHGMLDFRVTRDQYGHPISDAEDQMSRSVLTQVRTTQKPLVLRDAINDADFRQARSVRQLQLCSIMCVPLIAYGTALGAIYVENRSLQGHFKAANVASLVLFAHQAAMALDHATHTEQLEARVTARTAELAVANHQLAQETIQLHQQMTELKAVQTQLYDLSVRDSLTGLYNRRFLMEQLAHQFTQAKRYNRALSVVMVDIDHFKQVNATVMHAMGDNILMIVAQLIRETARESDVIARSGGEEFVIVLPETPLSRARQYAERVRASVEHYAWRTIHDDLSITISAGVASDTIHATYQALLHAADQQLYRAKYTGRNRVMTEHN